MDLVELIKYKFELAASRKPVLKKFTLDAGSFETHVVKGVINLTALVGQRVTAFTGYSSSASTDNGVHGQVLIAAEVAGKDANNSNPGVYYKPEYIWRVAWPDLPENSYNAIKKGFDPKDMPFITNYLNQHAKAWIPKEHPPLNDAKRTHTVRVAPKPARSTEPKVVSVITIIKAAEDGRSMKSIGTSDKLALEALVRYINRMRNKS